MASYKYVIVGGGLAGGKAVEGIRELDDDGSIATGYPGAASSIRASAAL